MDHVWFYKAVWNDAFVFWEFDLLDLQADVDLFDPPFVVLFFNILFDQKESFCQTLFKLFDVCIQFLDSFPAELWIAKMSITARFFVDWLAEIELVDNVIDIEVEVLLDDFQKLLVFHHTTSECIDTNTDRLFFPIAYETSTSARFASLLATIF